MYICNAEMTNLQVSCTFPEGALSFLKNMGMALLYLLYQIKIEKRTFISFLIARQRIRTWSWPLGLFKVCHGTLL